MTKQQEWFTPKEAANYLRLSVPMIYRLTQHGKLMAYHVQRSRRYRREDLDAVMQPDQWPAPDWRLAGRRSRSVVATPQGQGDQ